MISKKKIDQCLAKISETATMLGFGDQDIDPADLVADIQSEVLYIYREVNDCKDKDNEEILDEMDELTR